jgi:PadR family transcriptional regulator PadR
MPRHTNATKEADLLQGTLDMLILKVVAMGPNHGYGIAQRIQRISNEALQIRQGSLYPALYRLESRGWLKAEWKTTEGGREAKFYSLTRVGQQRLKAETQSWDRLCSAISLILQAAE